VKHPLLQDRGKYAVFAYLEKKEKKYLIFFRFLIVFNFFIINKKG